MQKPKSKVIGELKDADEKIPSATQSLREERQFNTLGTLVKTHGQRSQIGFLPTTPLEIDEETANAKLVVTFASKLGALVVWKRLELADGQEVFALCFPVDKWTPNADNELVVKQQAS